MHSVEKKFFKEKCNLSFFVKHTDISETLFPLKVDSFTVQIVYSPTMQKNN